MIFENWIYLHLLIMQQEKWCEGETELANFPVPTDDSVITLLAKENRF